MLVAGCWAMAKIEVSSNLNLFLPSGTTDTERFLLSELHQGAAARLLLMAIEGGNQQQRADLSRQLADRLRRNGEFQRVENGTLSLDINTTPLFEFRYLLTPDIDGGRFSTEGLRQSLQERLHELRNPLPSPFKPLLPRDPTGEYQKLIAQWLPQARPAMTQGVWSTEDGNRMLLLAETHAGSMDLNRQQQAVESIRSSFQALNESDTLRLIITGPGVFGVQSRELIQSESQWLSLLSSAAIMALLLATYRSWRYLILVAIPLSSALLSGVVITALLFGEVHGLTLAFGITLLGVTIDYPIHLFSHLRPGEAPTLAMGRIWKTLRLGVITTCIGYLTLVSTEFSGLRQLGVFTITGLLAAALTSRLVLPSLMRQPERQRQARLLDSLLELRLRGRLAQSTLAVLALLSLLPLWIDSSSVWQDDMATLTPLPRQAIDLDREIRGQLKAPETNQLIFLYADELESTLQAGERLQAVLQKLVAQGALSGFQSAVRHLPSQQTQQQRQSRLPSSAQIEERLTQVLDGLPFRKDAFRPFIEELEKSRQLPPVSLADLSGTPPGIHLDALLRQTDEGWLLLTPVSQVNDKSAVISVLAEEAPSASYLSLRDETRRLVSGLRHEINYRLAWGLGLMFLTLSLGLGSAKQAVRTLLPVLLALTLTLGLLQLLGEPLTLFHLIALMLVLGIGMDYSLFFNRREVSGEDRQRTLQALFICALSTAVVFTLLGLSAIPVLHAIGTTVSLGVVASFVLTLLMRRDGSPPAAAQSDRH
jgi:predicted exporter